MEILRYCWFYRLLALRPGITLGITQGITLGVSVLLWTIQRYGWNSPLRCIMRFTVFNYNQKEPQCTAQPKSCADHRALPATSRHLEKAFCHAHSCFGNASTLKKVRGGPCISPLYSCSYTSRCRWSSQVKAAGERKGTAVPSVKGEGRLSLQPRVNLDWINQNRILGICKRSKRLEPLGKSSLTSRCSRWASLASSDCE